MMKQTVEKIDEYRDVLNSIKNNLDKMTPHLKDFTAKDMQNYGNLYTSVAELLGKLNCLESLACKM